MYARKLLIGALVAGAMAAGAGWWYSGVEAGTDGAPDTVAVAVGDLETAVTALGKVEPLAYVDVGAQISGQIEAIHVGLGDKVVAGDLLAEIDPTVYEAQVAADLATLRGLEAQRAEQRARLKLAEQRYARNAQLFKARAVSREDLDASVAEAEAGRARLAVLDAEIEKARSTLQADEANLGYSRIVAPMSGTVMSLEVRTGQTISARQAAPVILRIADLDTMTVKAQVSEADVGKLTIGMDAYFSTLGDPARRWHGRLRQILPTPEVVNDVVLYNALFDVANDDGRLLPQMTAQVFFVLGRAEAVPLVPLSALIVGAEDGGHSVRVATGAGIETRAVRIGLKDRIQAAVIEGLQPGERVVVRPRPSGSRGGERRNGTRR